MEQSPSRTFAQLERQMKAARQLRAETVAWGFAHAFEWLSDASRRMVSRAQGSVHRERQSWTGIHQRTPRI
jgi:hypothetical protein